MTVEDFYLKQYEATRAEMLARQNQMSALTGVQVVAVGAAVAASSDTPEALLGAAIISLGLWIAFMYRQEGVQTREFQLKRQLEPLLLGKEGLKKRREGHRPRKFSQLFPGGIKHWPFKWPAIPLVAYYVVLKRPSACVTPSACVNPWYFWGPLLGFLVFLAFLYWVGWRMAGRLEEFRAEWKQPRMRLRDLLIPSLGEDADD